MKIEPPTREEWEKRRKILQKMHDSSPDTPHLPMQDMSYEELMEAWPNLSRIAGQILGNPEFMRSVTETMQRTSKNE